MKRLFPLVMVFFLFPSLLMYSQEKSGQAGQTDAAAGNTADTGTAGAQADGTGGNAPGADAAEKTEKKKTEEDYIEMDIKTSSLMELAAWCRELGLSEGGAREELASRLRAYYKLPSQTATAPEGQRIITIESAKTTEYFTLDVVNEEYARLKGDVIISLKDGNAVHRIKAWEILYNRTRNVMTATGKVEYVKEEGDTVETFKGDSITVNLDNWSSIFMNGASTRSVGGKSSAYRFAGTVISRNSEDVTVLSGADINNPDNDEAYWSLHASKLWLLPGNDWAILNAVLKVGNIPLLYVPFFYYPADEIVFHPVLGYRTREGTFLQTTTYILGRPKTEAVSENSITKIFGGASENMEKKREGVFLRTTGEKRTDPNDTRLSMLFDAYVNLGLYLGTELALPKNGPFGETALSAGLGYSRDIYPIGNINTPFPRYDGTSNWNKGNLFSFTIPFRYRFKLTSSFQIPNGSFSLALPYYSDPYVDRDFMRRSEALDWLSMLREGASPENEDQATLQPFELSSYEWRLSGSYTPVVTALAPYVGSLSISSIFSSLSFGSQISQKYNLPPANPLTLPNPTSPPNPGYAFFFPNKLTVYSVSATVSGRPFSTGAAPVNLVKGGTGPAPGDSLVPALPVSPWDTPGQNPADTANAGAANQGGNSPQDAYNYSPPVLSQRFSLPASGGPQLAMDYSLTPSSASELQFNSSAWKEQGDIDWGDISSILSKFRSDGSLGFTVTQPETSSYTTSLRLNMTGSWQDYSYMNTDATEFNSAAKQKDARDRADRETYFTSNWASATTLKPFFQSSIWGATNFQYNLQGLLAKNTVDNTGFRDWTFGSWDKTNISSNSVSANINANIMDYNQTLSLSAVLPPLDSSVSGNASIRAWISSTSVSSSVTKPMDSAQRKWNPVSVNETLTFDPGSNFQQTLVFDPEMKQYTTLTSSLNLWGFSANYSAAYTRPYRYNSSYGTPGAGSQTLWTLQNDPSLVPQQLSLGYNKTFAQTNLLGNRLSFSANITSSAIFDLQRYTNSKLSFNLGFTVGIANFLDLTLSTISENAVMYRYLQGLNVPYYSLPTELYQNQETNMFMDLFNSFRFDNNELRRKSGFKLKSMNVSMVHHLGDWNAKLSMTMTPILDKNTFPYTYKFSNEISFLIQWVPISEIKTQIDYTQEQLTIK